MCVCVWGGWTGACRPTGMALCVGENKGVHVVLCRRTWELRMDKSVHDWVCVVGWGWVQVMLW